MEILTVKKLVKSLTAVLGLGLIGQGFSLNLPFNEICQGHYSETVSAKQVEAYAGSMADRSHRIWHYFWHGSRNSWHQMNDEDRDFFLRVDGRWSVPRLMGAPNGEDRNDPRFDPRKNDAGEDFLFMHHVMLGEVQRLMRANNLDCIKPWLELPGPNDNVWGVPPGNAEVKSNAAFRRMSEWDQQFRNPNWLRGKTLGNVGYLVETSLHNNMHMRWATNNPPVGDRPEITSVSMGGLKPFDSPVYNWLADSYSAHVNPVFWKLHGLVEHVMYKWLEANGFTSIALQCGNIPNCYQWKGTWTGGMPEHAVINSVRSSDPDVHQHHHEDAGEKISKAIDDYVEGRSDPDPSPIIDAIRNKRRAVVDKVMKLMHANSLMNFAEIKEDELKALDTRPELADPEKYIEYIRAKAPNK